MGVYRRALAVLFSASLFAQSVGRIAGTVCDPTGAIVPGATFTCTNPQNGLNRNAETNQEGIFVFPDLPIGTYTLEISKQGFAAR